MDKLQIVLATQNLHKVKEIKQIWKDLPVEILALNEFKSVEVAEETGTSFKENALLKAWAISKQTQLPAVADDSGFCVEALEGRPGIYSARYAGEKATDEQNLQKVLSEYLASPNKINKNCKFVCAAAFVDSASALEWVCEGEVQGEMLEQPVGSNGFGYDPLFFYPPYQKAFAEVGQDQKNLVSHRARAFAQLGQFLKDWMKR